ncbi:MAG: hypothetical protein H6Q31_1045 [Bacteroidetes bacterium]|nr:hypothetical protein [Bacteroidota bacterium]
MWGLRVRDEEFGPKGRGATNVGIRQRNEKYGASERGAASAGYRGFAERGTSCTNVQAHPEEEPGTVPAQPGVVLRNASSTIPGVMISGNNTGSLPGAYSTYSGTLFLPNVARALVIVSS